MKEKDEVVKKGYNKIAKRYHEQRDIYSSTKLLKKFTKYLKNGKVLDLGCGAGVPIDKYLIKNNYDVTGADFSDSMINLAKKNVPKAKFMKMDITNIKFKENSFDGAVSFYAIIHIPKEKHSKIYKSLHKIIKPNGIILVNCCGSIAWEGYEENYLGVKMFWSHYEPKKTKEIIEASGFNVIWDKILKIGGEKQYWILAKNIK